MISIWTPSYLGPPLGRPCKIVEMSTSKTGKHGHAKVHLVAIDVWSSAFKYPTVIDLSIRSSLAKN